MNYEEVRRHLRKAEDELIALIVKTDDFSERERCLQLARQVRELSDAMSEPASDAGQSKFSSHVVAGYKAQNTFDGAAVFPAYFIHAEKLYKVGKKDDSSVYKKALPASDAAVICDSARTLLKDRDYITTADVKAAIPGTPDYKVQIVLMALVSTRTLKTVGKGKYAIGPGPTPKPKTWYAGLESLPDKYDLISQ